MGGYRSDTAAQSLLCWIGDYSLAIPFGFVLASCHEAVCSVNLELSVGKPVRGHGFAVTALSAAGCVHAKIVIGHVKACLVLVP